MNLVLLRTELQRTRSSITQCLNCYSHKIKCVLPRGWQLGIHDFCVILPLRMQLSVSPMWIFCHVNVNIEPAFVALRWYREKMCWARNKHDYILLLFGRYDAFLASPLAATYPKFTEHLTSMYDSKKEKWCSAYRSGALVRGNHTNNYVESSMRILKDQVWFCAIYMCIAFLIIMILKILIFIIKKFWCPTTSITIHQLHCNTTPCAGCVASLRKLRHAPRVSVATSVV